MRWLVRAGLVLAVFVALAFVASRPWGPEIAISPCHGLPGDRVVRGAYTGWPFPSVVQLDCEHFRVDESAFAMDAGIYAAAAVLLVVIGERALARARRRRP